jgi:hypothetical protein
MNWMNSMAVPGVQTEDQMARNLFVVSRRYPDLYEYLRERFASDSAVEVILDRRVGQRRKIQTGFEGERRRGDRRHRPEVEIELQSRSHAIITIPDMSGQ